MACRWKWAETGRQQRPRREGPGGSRRGHCPGPRSPSYRPGGQHPTSEQEKSHTHRTSHHSRAPLSTGAAGPTATPKPGDGGSESGAQTCPPGATATAAGKWLAPERGRVGEKVLCATVRGSGSQGLSPQEPLLGEDLRGPLGSWQGEGTSLLRLAPDLPPHLRRFPAVCGLLAPPPHAAHPPHPGLHEAAARREAHHSAPSPGPALGAAVLRQGTGVRFSVSGAHGQEPVPSVGRHGSRGEGGESDPPSSSPACPPGADPSSSR